jgi:hypothetical protein
MIFSLSTQRYCGERRSRRLPRVAAGSHAAPVNAHFSQWLLKFHTRELSLAVCVYLYTRGAATRVRFLASRRKGNPHPRLHSLTHSPDSQGNSVRQMMPLPQTRSTCSRPSPGAARSPAIRPANKKHRKIKSPVPASNDRKAGKSCAFSAATAGLERYNFGANQ